MKNNSMKKLVALLGSLVLLSTVTCQAFTSNYATQSDLVYSSTDSISASDLSKVLPVIPKSYQQYTQAGGVFGYYGPLGPFGPLGTLGPIGNNFWNPSQMISGMDWSSYSSLLTISGGPLSKLGPLGLTGPLNEDIYTGKIEPGLTLFASNPYAQQLRGLGLWSALGSIGPLGALGPLGPLGSIGSHGYRADAYGNFRDSSNKIARSVVVDYDGKSNRTYNLVETYSGSYAASHPELLDTSFMITGSFSSSSQTSQFTFTSQESQIVTIVLVPEKSLDVFSLGLYDVKGRLIGTSESKDFVQTMQIKVVAGQSLSVAVRMVSSMQFFSKSYRLIVVGSTQYLNMNNVSGNHLLQYYECPRCTATFAKTIKMSKLL